MSSHLLLQAILLLIVLLPASAFAFPADFDGDGKTDLALWRNSDGYWYVYPSSFPTASNCPSPVDEIWSGGCRVQWGLPGDIPLSGDYDGDGRAVPTVYRPSTRTFWILFSSYDGAVAVTSGNVGDQPDEGDFDNDGKSDIVLYRDSTKQWKHRSSIHPHYYVNTYSAGSDGPDPQDPLVMVSNNYETPNGTIPEMTKFIPNNHPQGVLGLWRSVSYSTGVGDSEARIITEANGNTDDIVVMSGNYGGTATQLTDYVTWHIPTGTWYVRFNSTAGGSVNPNIVFQWGLPGDIPMSGDYLGASTADYVVWRPSIGTWFFACNVGCPLYGSPTTGGVYMAWGLPGDTPVP